ncbi:MULTISPECIES: glutamine amidotransferase [unclassified Wenzhouxiangella]|uniref:glutamine amidotransferase n=1 Tax=unclassified Wenzhouxiangella TaxID=2613841 RepID=UPI000E327A11|nr:MULTISPECIES: glutamine amidotransferase [unclassified Wenzhouxiangella]RFF26795.1 glutamine amidotransferase [Wenzhouxiangella sp. 15181]RFP67681.1 glutamine amidotransferase [Wenzhouxiangella sp. 15190]
MTRDRLLIVKTGSAAIEARRRFGDFERWFARAIGPDRFDYETVDVSDHEILPSLETAGDYAGVVVTGSPAMVSHRLDWSERTARWLAEVIADDRLPVLGVCYGHQLIAHALGGRVGPNPDGRRMGTDRFKVGQADDGLVGPLAPEAPVQVTHLEVVLDAPPGARVLGRTAVDANHALHFGGRSWGVQFHPEFDAVIMRCYVEARADLLDGEGFDSRAILDNVRETRAGINVLRRFAAICDADRGGGNGESR